jgi:hypothetical protein
MGQNDAASTNPGVTSSDFYSTFAFESKANTTWVKSIVVSAPAQCSEIKGDTAVTFKAPGMTVAKANCWQQPAAANPWGHDADLAPGLKLDADGNGSFIFHADQFPSGPITVRLYAKDSGSNQDYYEIQLFNKGGVSWNEGIPKSDPPAAKGMKLAFSDDFTGPLSISKDDSGTYWTHCGGGDGSTWPFGENEGPNNPFSQVGTYLRIHASKPPGTDGVTGSLTPIHPRSDKPGITVKAPCYIEGRFLALNAPGTWPALWVTTQSKDKSIGCDEMDLIEGYGTNSKNGGIWTAYHCTTHFWGQPVPAWVSGKELGPDGHPYQAHRMLNPAALGGKSSWSTTFHTYGLLVTQTETAYYLDNIEVLRHPTGKLAATLPMTFIVNLAIGGGGWSVDLQRYGNQADMWVDYIRMYEGAK